MPNPRMPVKSIRNALFTGILGIVPLTAMAYNNGVFGWNASAALTTVRAQSVDFSANSSSHPWPTLTGGLKYETILLQGLKGCADVRTSQRNTVAGDTRIWVRKNTSPASSWTSLDNDGGTDKYSAARIWMEDPNLAMIEVAFAANTTAYNSMDFSYQVVPVAATSKTACEDTTIPLMTDINGTLTYYRKN